MANDSSLLPSTPTPPAAATLTTSSAGSGATANNAIAYDYSPHLIRVVTALEQLSYSLAFIADKMDNVSDKLSDLARQSASQTSLLSTLSTNISTLSTNSTTFTTAAIGSGIHTTGPLDWVGLVSSYKLYVEDSGAIGLTALTEYKAKIDALPREF
jgi:hypothetical protein